MWSWEEVSTVFTYIYHFDQKSFVPLFSSFYSLSIHLTELYVTTLLALL